MAKNKSSKFGLADGFLFEEDNTSNSSENVIEIPLSELHTFKGHPFKVNDDEKMQETVDSIKEHGVLVPGIVRRRDAGGYEIISGHRRKRACEIIGLEKMPVFIKDLTDDEAIVTMVDSNIQREELLPSEKAKAYKMRYDAIKHQGKSTGSGKSLEEMSADSGDSRATIQRLIAIADINSDLLQLIDEKKMGIAQGVNLAALTDEEQEQVVEVINDTSIIPSMIQSAEIKDLSKQHDFDVLKVRDILIGKPKPNKRKLTIKDRKLKEYFPEEYTSEQIEEVVFKLLDEWKASQE